MYLYSLNIQILALALLLPMIAISAEPECELFVDDGYGAKRINRQCDAAKAAYQSGENTANAAYARRFVVQDLPLNQYRDGTRGIAETIDDLQTANVSYSLSTMNPRETDCGLLNVHFASEIYGENLDVRIKSMGEPGYLQCDLMLRDSESRVRVLTVLLGRDLHGGKEVPSGFGTNWGFFSDFGRGFPNLPVEPLSGLGDSAGSASPSIHNTALLKVQEDRTEAAIFGALGENYDEQQPAPLSLLAVLLAQFVHDVTTD